MASPNRDSFLAGVRAELPILVGVVPFGLIFGAVAVAGGLPPLLAQAMSSVIFAGSAQFIGAQLIAGGAAGYRDLLSGEKVLPGRYDLPPYGFVWLKEE